jgi:hypothetical protein
MANCESWFKRFGYYFIIYPTCIDPLDKHNNFQKNIRANASKITQSVIKEILCMKI